MASTLAMGSAVQLRSPNRVTNDVHKNHIDATETSATSKEPNRRFLPPIEDKKSSKEHELRPALPESDFLPQELLVALKRKDTTEGSAKMKNGTPMKSPHGKSSLRPPANVWSHPKQRYKYKHLVDNAPCICGAGRDVSFLYDAVGPSDQSPNSKPTMDTLIPSEFHIVKHPGVHGTEFRDDQYTLRTEDHQKHATVFPSLNPTSRQEVLALKQTLSAMLEKAGLYGGEDGDMELSLDGPTQLHNVLELIKTEQKIYNIVFHEIIRQVSVTCGERGELLSELRKKYSELLGKVPEQIKSLHDELLAQRGLGRRLASELTEFRGNVADLTRELSAVKEHDFLTIEQIKEDKEMLRRALETSEKNASALQEYRDIYEMQRKRLESKISELKCERDLWQQATYKLANKVADRQSLQSIRRIQICERSWFNLTQHFAVLLSDKDLQQLLVVQDHIQSWREACVGAVSHQLSIDRQLKSEILSVQKSMKEWNEVLESHTGSLDSDEIYKLADDIDHWDQVLSRQYGNFAGDLLLRRQEQIKRLSHLVESWTDEALALFHRHSPSGATSVSAHHDRGKVTPSCSGLSKNDDVQSGPPPTNTALLPKKDSVQLSSPSARQEEESLMMTELNGNITSFLHDLSDQVAGEHGVASALMHVGTPVEAWSQKFKLIVQISDKQIAFSEQKKFHADLSTWVSDMASLLDVVNPASTVEDTKLGDLLSEATAWLKALTSYVNSKDSQISFQAEQIHTALTHWMVDCLLFVTRSPGDEDFEFVLGQVDKVTQSSLKSRSLYLGDQLSDYTSLVSRCCSDVVYEIAARHRQDGASDDVAEVEVKELRKMEGECRDWIKMVGLMMEQMLEDLTSITMDDTAEKGDETTMLPEVPKGDVDSTNPDNEYVYVVGEDSNIHCKSLSTIQQRTNTTDEMSTELGCLPTVNDVPSLPAELMPRPEDLLVEMDKMEQTIKSKEEAIASAQQRAREAETQLQEALAKISTLESSLNTAEQGHHEGHHKKHLKHKKATKGSTVTLLSGSKKIN